MKQNENREQPVAKKTISKQRSTLTLKEMAFANELLNNPKQSATKAVLKTYDTTDYKTAGVIASENLKKPRIMTYLQENARVAEDTVIDVMNYSRQLGKTGTKEGASYAGVALASAKEVLDRVHGKSTQRVEQVSTGVSINIDLTSSLE